jgi:predicted dithiol-disulfide oxidoreductase (DUF899 family)
MDEINYSFKPTDQVSTFYFKPDYNISFHKDGQEIGKLDFNGPEMVFTGDAEESAKVFIDWIARSFAGRLEEERKAEREMCAQLCEDQWQTAHDIQDAIRARGNT